ncbi:MAG: response regulator transcription factor [Elusimicrobiales bacterium]
MERRILIVDDDANMRESLSESLDLEGFKCFEAKNSKEGLEQFKKNLPDVVIMDIQLPDSIGFQLCQEMRKLSKDVVIIMMSGRFLSSEEKTQGFTLGADEYITKPFDIRELSVRIKQLLSRKGK